MLSTHFSPHLDLGIDRDPLTVTPEATLVDVFGLLTDAGNTCTLPKGENLVERIKVSSCVLVVAGEKLLGILTEQDLVRLIASGERLEDLAVAEVMTATPKALIESDYRNIFTALVFFRQHQVHHLPIVKTDGSLVGIVTVESIRSCLKSVNLLKMRLVSEVMKTSVITASVTTSLIDIARLMVEHQVRYVTIIEPISKIPLEIITEGDIVQCQGLKIDLVHIPVSAAIAKPLSCVQLEDYLWQAQEKMTQENVKCLAVTGRQGELLGIVTQDSLLHSVDVVGILQKQVRQLESEKIELLKDRNAQLAKEVEARTAKLQQQAERERLFNKITSKIHQSLNLPDILHTAVEEVREFLGCDRVLVYQLDNSLNGKIVAESVVESQLSILERNIKSACFSDSCQEKFLNRQVHAIPDLNRTKLEHCYRKFLEGLQVKANLVVPILIEEITDEPLDGTISITTEPVNKKQIWGLLIAHECLTARDWEQSEIDLLNELSLQIAIAIRQAQLFQQAQMELAERKRAELSLKENQRLLTSIFNNTFQSIGLLTAEGIVLAVNQTSLTMGGIELADVIGKPFWETRWWAISAETQQQLKSAIAQAATGKFIRYEVNILAAKNAIVTVDFSLKPVKDETGKITLLIPECRDITQEKRTLEALYGSEQRFRSLSESSPLGIVLIDAEGYTTYVNPRCQTICGFTFEQALGTGWQDFIHPHDRQWLFVNWTVATLQRQEFSGEYRFQHQNGTIRWVQTYISPILSAEGELRGYVGTIEDISDRKQAKEALEQLNQQLENKVQERTLELAKTVDDLQNEIAQRQEVEALNTLLATAVEQAGDAIKIVNAQGKIEYVNPAFEIISGYKAAEAIGKTPASLFSNNQADQYFYDHIWQHISTGEVWRSRMISQRQDGSLYTHESTISPVINDLGTVTHYVSVKRDITEQNRIQTALEESQANLQKQTDILTAVLNNMGDGVIVEDNHGELLILNPAAQEILGSGAIDTSDCSEKYGLFLSDEVTPCPPEELPVARAIRGETANNILIFIRNPSKPQGVWADCTISPLKDRDGVVKGGLTVFRDITERKQAEKALRESELRLQLALDTAEMGTWDFDLSTKKAIWSEKTQAIFGFTPESFPGVEEACLQTVPPKEQNYINQKLSQCLEQNIPYETEYRIILPNGNARWVTSKANVQRDKTGKAVSISGVTIDITNRKLAEEKLLQKSQALAAFNAILKQLHHLSTQHFDSAESLFAEYLQQGCEIFQLETGIINKIGKNNCYTILAVKEKNQLAEEENSSLPIFQSLANEFNSNLVDTYYAEVSRSKKTVFYRYTGNMPKMQNCPIYQSLKLESYIGTPIFVNHQLYGTLNFASTAVRLKEFQIYEQEIIELMAQSIGNFIHAEEIQKKHQEAEAERSRVITILEASIDYIGVADLQGNILWNNHAMRRISRVAEDADISQANIPQYHPAWAFDIVKNEGIPAAIRDGVWMGETAIINPDNGEDIPVSQMIIAHKSPEGAVEYMSTIMRDITTIKQAENDLRESETRYRLLAENSVDMISRHTEAGDYLYVSPACFNLLGYHPEELLGNNCYDFFHPDDIDRVKALNSKTLAKSEKQSLIIYRLRHKNGQYIWIETAAKWVIDPITDEVTEIVKVMRDVSERQTALQERKLAEQALQESQQLLQRIASATPSILYIYDLTKQSNVYSNREIASILGYTPEEIKAMGSGLFSNLIHPDDLARLPEVYEKIDNLADGEISEFEYRMKNRNGEWRWLNGRDTVFNRNADGKVCQTVGAATDITQRKLVEEQLQKTNEELAIINTQLVRATRLKDEFLASMSHELRTPLNSILGFSEALLDEVYGELTPKQAKSLKSIEKSGRHLLELINDILDLAKIESGKVELQIAPTSIPHLCQSSLVLVQQLAEHKNIQLSLQVAEGLREIAVDERRMRQVLINLLSNAVKFTPEGGSVSLAVHGEESTSTINFSVIDTGIGIAQENMDKLFQSFVQIDSSLSRRYAGTGLGLALVKKTVELHKGVVTVESELGQGSCFTAKIPY